MDWPIEVMQVDIIKMLRRTMKKLAIRDGDDDDDDERR